MSERDQERDATEEIVCAALGMTSALQRAPDPLAVLRAVPEPIAFWVEALLFAAGEFPDTPEPPPWFRPAAQRMNAKLVAFRKTGDR